jgi:polysaccharide export outer membrane protein
MNYKLFILVTLVSIIYSSCSGKKDIHYLQNLEKTKNQPIPQNYENSLQADDVISISVSSIENVGLSSFNLTTNNSTSNSSGGSKPGAINYVIRKDGSIEFPILGKIQIAGFTISKAIEMIKIKLEKYIKDPIVMIEWHNFKFSVLGEVANPGLFVSKSERVTLLEALAMAGDLSIYGERKSIILIREIDSKRNVYTIDLTNPSLLNEESYFIKQNDQIIVSPNNTKIQSTSSFNQNVPVYLSIASILLTLTILLRK